MSLASDIAAARIIRENENIYRSDVYDDKTLLPIILPSGGNPAIGYGCRTIGWSRQFSQGVIRLNLADFERQVVIYRWYLGHSNVRRSVLLDLAFKIGAREILNLQDFSVRPSSKNWDAARTQLLASRILIDKSVHINDLADILETDIDQ